MRTRWILLIVLPVLVLTGCGSSQAGGQNEEQAPSTALAPPSQVIDSGLPKSDLSLPPSSTPTNETPVSMTIDPALQSLADEARQDLAQRLNVEIDQIEEYKIVPAKWPYEAVGCPPNEAGNVDQNSPGYQILLIHENQLYYYHTDGTSWLVFCNALPTNEVRTLP